VRWRGGRLREQAAAVLVGIVVVVDQFQGGFGAPIGGFVDFLRMLLTTPPGASGTKYARVVMTPFELYPRFLRRSVLHFPTNVHRHVERDNLDIRSNWGGFFAVRIADDASRLGFTVQWSSNNEWS